MKMSRARWQLKVRCFFFSHAFFIYTISFSLLLRWKFLPFILFLPHAFRITLPLQNCCTYIYIYKYPPSCSTLLGINFSSFLFLYSASFVVPRYMHFFDFWDDVRIILSSMRDFLRPWAETVCFIIIFSLFFTNVHEKWACTCIFHVSVIKSY